MNVSLLLADVLTRTEVNASREGWVTDKRYGDIIGLVTADVNAAGQPIWKAQAGDVGSFAFKRADAIARVIELHNMQEKARAYELLARRVTS